MDEKLFPVMLKCGPLILTAAIYRSGMRPNAAGGGAVPGRGQGREGRPVSGPQRIVYSRRGQRVRATPWTPRVPRVPGKGLAVCRRGEFRQLPARCRAGI